MPYSSKAVTNSFLDLAREQSRLLTPMKVQKLVYYAHGWHLATAGPALIFEPVEAWRWGPVIRSLYAELAGFGNKPIDRNLQELIPSPKGTGFGYSLRDYEIDGASEEGAYALGVVSRVWDLYGDLSAVQLSKMTHEPGTPWDTVARQFNFEIPDNTVISNDLIREYFRAQALAEKH